MKSTDLLTVLQGDVLHRLRQIPDESVQCVVTSPPYWALRDYGVPGQLGLEPTLQEYLAKMVAVFEEVRRVLRKDGVCWVNMGDSYSSGGRGGNPTRDSSTLQGGLASQEASRIGRRQRHSGLKDKEVVGQPWRLAFRLQDAGWYLRQDIIWHKPNPHPESVYDRCTKAHEYLFMLTKSDDDNLWRARDTGEWRDAKPDMSERIPHPLPEDPEHTIPRWATHAYYWDRSVMLEKAGASTHARVSQDVLNQRGSERAYGGVLPDRPMKAVYSRPPGVGPKAAASAGTGSKANGSFNSALVEVVPFRNRRSVWSVPSENYKGAHFATFPTALVRPCILASTRPGDLVLDPFGGSGTTGLVALQHGRKATLIELNPEYVALIRQRCAVQQGLL